MKAGERRRGELVESALTTLSERGLGRVRVKDIAEAAGVATGTVHYHFSDLEELFLEVHELAVRRFVGDREAAIGTLDDGRDKLRALASTGVADDGDDVVVAALYELAPLVRRYDSHRLLMRSLALQQRLLYGTAFEVGKAQGHFTFTASVPDLAANAVALEDAYGLHIWSGTGFVTPAEAKHLLLLHLAEVTHCSAILDDQPNGRANDSRD